LQLGQNYFEMQHSYTIWGFRGLFDILNLKQQPMTEEMMKMLKKRGKVFKEVSLGHHFKQYNGFLLVDRGWGNNLYKAHGRVMVDITTFQVTHTLKFFPTNSL
jgi:hypothetical protein